MKDMKYYLRFIVLMLCVSFVACSEDDKGTTPVFPELQEIECAVGEEQTLTFDATSDWTLVSSALWCKFMVDGQEAFTCSGTAGKQSVTIRIGDDATELMKSYKAELTLMSGGAKQVIFTVTRPVTEEELHVFNTEQTVEYTVENPLPKSYEKYIWNENQRIVVSANVDWIVEWSDEFGCENAEEKAPNEELTPSGDAGETVTLKLSLKEGYTKSAWEGALTFKNRKNEIIYTLPIKYDGIPADKLESTYESSKDRDVVFVHQGYSYTWENKINWGPMPNTVIARNDEYVKVYVDYVKVYNPVSELLDFTCTTMTEEESWFFADDEYAENPGELSIGVLNNQGGERTGYLMVFPQEVYNRIKSNFDEIVFSSEDGIVGEYMEYLVTSIKQSANPSAAGGFKVTNGLEAPLLDEDNNEIKAEPFTSMSPSELENIYGTSKVFMLSLPNSLDYPVVKIDANVPADLETSVETVFNGKNTVWTDLGVRYEQGWLGFMLYQLNAGVKGDDDMVFTFLDPENTPWGVLLVSRY